MPRRRLLTIICLSLPTQNVYGGTVTLEAASNWCCVEVRSGNLIPAEANPVVRSGPVSPGPVYQGLEDEAVCFRRENNQGDANSGMEVNINCDTPFTSGNEVFTIH